jgi:CRP-like cAMP-binding protein
MAQSDLERLLTLGKQRSLKAGEFACREDELGSEFFIILSGEVVVLARGQEVNRLYQGDYFGEVALLLNIPRIASVQAVTDTQLLVLDRKGLQTLLQDFPELSDRIFLSLSDRRAELQKRQQLLEQVGVDTQSNGGYLNWVKQKLHALRQLFPAQVN